MYKYNLGLMISGLVFSALALVISMISSLSTLFMYVRLGRMEFSWILGLLWSVILTGLWILVLAPGKKGVVSGVALGVMALSVLGTVAQFITGLTAMEYDLPAWVQFVSNLVYLVGMILLTLDCFVHLDMQRAARWILLIGPMLLSALITMVYYFVLQKNLLGFTAEAIFVILLMIMRSLPGQISHILTALAIANTGKEKKPQPWETYP